MLSIAFWVLSATVVLGTFLALMHIRSVRSPPWKIAAAHGVLGSLGIATLIVALSQDSNHGVEYGVSFFGRLAAALASLALFLGLAIIVRKRRSVNGVGLIIGAHATFAITAYVLLLAYLSLG